MWARERHWEGKGGDESRSTLMVRPPRMLSIDWCESSRRSLLTWREKKNHSIIFSLNRESFPFYSKQKHTPFHFSKTSLIPLTLLEEISFDSFSPKVRLFKTRRTQQTSLSNFLPSIRWKAFFQNQKRHSTQGNVLKENISRDSKWYG